MEILIPLILVNVLLLVIFRVFKSYNIDVFQAIVFNYITAVTVGSLVLGRFPLSLDSPNEKWFPYSIILGILFIWGFNLLGKAVQIFGVTLTSIAQKMAMIMTVPFTVYFFSESMTTLKGVGILAALVSIVLINIPKKGLEVSDNKMKSMWYLLLLTFVISGVIEIILFYVEAMDYSSDADIGFVVALFGMAAIIGAIIMVAGLVTKKLTFHWKNIIGGIALGIPNFFTIYMLLKLINSGMEGSLIFPILNVSIILLSAVLGVTIFKEKLSKLQWFGFLLGILCIILIAIG